MRKIRILFIFLCLLSFQKSFSQTWSGDVDSQWVSTTVLNDAVSSGVFKQVGEIPSSSGAWFVKDSVLNWIAIDQSNIYYRNKSGNQIIAKRDLTPATIPACGSSVNFYQDQSNPNGNSVYVDAGTTSGQVTLEFDTIQPSIGTTSPMYIIYGDDTLSTFTPWTYQDTSINFSYSYSPLIGSYLKLKYLYGNGDQYAAYKVTTTCPSSNVYLDFSYDGTENAVKVVISGTISGDIHINNTFLAGYIDQDCTNEVEEAETQEYTITSGTTGTVYLPMSPAFTGSSIYFHFEDGVSIEGTHVHDGGTITVNNQTVHVQVIGETCTQLNN